MRVSSRVLRALLLYFIRVFKTVGSDANSQRAAGQPGFINPETVPGQNVVRIRYAVSVSKNNFEY